MKKENLLKFALIFGGGYLLFLMMKPKKNVSFSDVPMMPPPPPPPPPKPVAKIEDKKPEFTEQDFQNAEIVANAYSEALKAGEPSENLTELNKELMKEFNMRCYIDNENNLVVCDSKGNKILTK